MSGLFPSSRAKFLLLLCAAAGACQSQAKFIAAERQSLSQACQSIEQQQFDAARQNLRGLLARTRTEPRVHDLQRFHAHALLSHIELNAGLQATNEIQAVEHLVAVHWHNARARQALQAVRARGAVTPAREMLPAKLAHSNTQDVVTGSDLACLASSARLGVASAADVKLELTRADLLSVESLLEGSKIPGPARVWIYLEAFDRLATADDPNALAFGVAVLDAQEGHVPASRLEQIGAWLTSGRVGVLACPDDGELLDPRVPVCTQCGRMRRDFRRVSQPISMP